MWQNNALLLLTALFSWTILHFFFIASLSHITLSGHMGHKTKFVGLCEQKMIDSVRGLLDLTYAITLPIWAIYLLVAVKLDVESHAFFQVSALGYNLYSTYWALKNFSTIEERKAKDPERNEVIVKTNKMKLIHFIQHISTTIIVMASIRALSNETSKWRNSIIPLMLDMHPSSAWGKPSVVQRKALAHHLLGKTSEIAWLLTLNLLVHETPNIFFHLLKLLRLSKYQTSQMKECVWTTNNYAESVQAAASLGTAAWRRERGVECSPSRQKSKFECVLSTFHRVFFVLLRIIGGFAVLNRILMAQDLVRDTTYVVSALLYQGMATYLFVGILAFTAKESNLDKKYSKESLSWQLATSVSDEWLRLI